MRYENIEKAVHKLVQYGHQQGWGSEYSTTEMTNILLYHVYNEDSMTLVEKYGTDAIIIVAEVLDGIGLGEAYYRVNF